METLTEKETTTKSRTNNNTSAKPAEEPQPHVDFFTDIKVYDQLAHQKRELELQMEQLRSRIIPSFNERFASLGIALPESVVRATSQSQTTTEHQETSKTRAPKNRGTKDGGMTKLAISKQLITDKLPKRFAVKDFKIELEKDGKDNWQIGYIIQALKHEKFLKNVGYGEYERV
jgi:hypothetical protein